MVYPYRITSYLAVKSKFYIYRRIFLHFWLVYIHADGGQIVPFFHQPQINRRFFAGSAGYVYIGIKVI